MHAVPIDKNKGREVRLLLFCQYTSCILSLLFIIHNENKKHLQKKKLSDKDYLMIFLFTLDRNFDRFP